MNLLKVVLKGKYLNLIVNFIGANKKFSERIIHGRTHEQDSREGIFHNNRHK